MARFIINEDLQTVANTSTSLEAWQAGDAEADAMATTIIID